MADNYLEKRMDDYRRGALSPRRTGYPSSGYWRLKIPRLRVMIAGPVSSCVQEVIRMYASMGCKVVFCHENSLEGREISQKTGALFFPSDSTIDWAAAYDFAVERWGGVDIIVITAGSTVISGLQAQEGTRIISLNCPIYDGSKTSNVAVSFNQDIDYAVLARVVMFLSLPDNHVITGQTISLE